MTTFESDGDIFAAARRYAGRFRKIETDMSVEKTIIGIVASFG